MKRPIETTDVGVDLHSAEFISQELGFSLVQLRPGFDPATRLTVENLTGDQFSRGHDMVFYKLNISPPLPIEYWQDCALLRGNLRRQRMTPLFSVNLDDQVCVEECVQEQYHYFRYPTHDICVMVDPKSGATCASYVLLCVENNQISSKEGAAPILQLRVDMGEFFLQHAYSKRYIGLPYLPLNVNMLPGLAFTAAQVQQRTPYWIGLRLTMAVSGTKANKFGAGYFPEDEKLATGADEARKQSMMRIGRVSETSLLITYLENHPTHIFYEQGFVPFPGEQTWGVSPDGLALDPHLTWESYPKKTKEQYGSFVDPTRIALEFKCSLYSDKFPDYYIPQVYWEMICLGCAQGKLLRYKRRFNEEDVDYDGTSCMEYTIFRDKDIETMLLNNVRHAYNAVEVTKTKTLAQLATEPAFVEARNKFKQIAERAQSTALTIPVPQLKAYREQFRKALNFVGRTGAKKLLKVQQEEEDEFIARHKRFVAAPREEALKIGAEQVQAYVDLMSQMLKN
jgi:hypothetical protein